MDTRFTFKMSKPQPSLKIISSSQCIQNDDREKDDWMELICLQLKEKGDEKQREHANVILPRYTVSCFSLSLQLPFANFIRLPTN
jgi:hypothetical protein